MHPRVSLHQICFPAESDLVADLDLCAAAGFHHVGLMSPKLAGREPSEVRRLLDERGLGLSTLTHAPLFSPGDPERRGERVEALLASIETAAVIGSPNVYGTTGGAGGLSWNEARAVVVEMSHDIEARSADLDVPVLVEMAMQLYSEHTFVHTLADTLELVEGTSLGVNLDIFACWSDRDLRHALARGIKRIKLCQVSDFRFGTRTLPARVVPGDGDLPVERTLGWILDAGYDGMFELELQSSELVAEGLGDAVARAGAALSTMLSALGA